MTAENWTRAVRRQLRLGRLLPLGGPRDGTWITESAAATELRRAADALPDVRLVTLRVGPAPGAATAEPSVLPPPSGLPPGPLCITADFMATAAQPLPARAAQLRTTLATAATDRLGLDLAAVDLRVTGLLGAEFGGADGGGTRDEERRDAEGPDEEVKGPESDVAEGPEAADEETRIRHAASAVPGVSRLTGTLGGRGRAVHLRDAHPATAALPRRHVQLELAVRQGPRALDVATAVRRAVAAALPDEPTVAVVVTAVDGPAPVAEGKTGDG